MTKMRFSPQTSPVARLSPQLARETGYMSWGFHDSETYRTIREFGKSALPELFRLMLEPSTNGLRPVYEQLIATIATEEVDEPVAMDGIPVRMEGGFPHLDPALVSGRIINWGVLHGYVDAPRAAN